MSAVLKVALPYAVIMTCLSVAGFMIYELHRESVRMYEDRQAECRRSEMKAYPGTTEAQAEFDCEFGVGKPKPSGGVLP